MFITVRSRNPSHYTTRAESIPVTQQRRMIKTTNYYLQQPQLFDKFACRFNVAAITNFDSCTDVHWLKDTFQVRI